jgi:hypothetical protein
VGDIFNEDFLDFISCFNETEVDYILVGGYATILHGYNRTTGDLDIWVKQTIENYSKIEKAFALFSMPLFDMNRDKFLNVCSLLYILIKKGATFQLKSIPLIDNR